MSYSVEDQHCVRKAGVFIVALLVATIQASAEVLPIEVFDRFWDTAKAKVYPPTLVATHFADEDYRQLRQQAAAVNSIYELTPLINKFLSQLGVSHTRFYDDQSIDFYLFRSMFGTQNIAKPKVNHIGAQYIRSNDNYVIREIVSGYPAERAGLRRGDRLLKANDAPFHPYRSFNPDGTDVRLTIQRNERTQHFVLSAIRENPNQSLSKAIPKSVRVFRHDGRRIGYVRLWSGTHPTNLESFRKAVLDDLGDADAIIVDLRGGFGGAWYAYLDVFFADRSSYFEFSITNRNEVTHHKAVPQQNDRYFPGPMIALINEGTRSGKESLAYQFKKSKRALLVGTTTEGAFTAGEGIFNERDKPYFLYLATAEYRLDGNKIEGVGIRPHVRVDYDLTKSAPSDPQLKVAVDEAVKLINGKDSDGAGQKSPASGLLEKGVRACKTISYRIQLLEG